MESPEDFSWAEAKEQANKKERILSFMLGYLLKPELKNGMMRIRRKIHSGMADRIIAKEFIGSRLKPAPSLTGCIYPIKGGSRAPNGSFR